MVAAAIAGQPILLRCQRLWVSNLIGKLQDWVSAKDIILENAAPI